MNNRHQFFSLCACGVFAIIISTACPFNKIEGSVNNNNEVLPYTVMKAVVNISDTEYITTTRALKSNKIPDSVFEMKHLKYLYISGMDCDYGDNTHCWSISEVPEKIGQLTELETLSLIVNSISSLPVSVSKLSKLRMLDLTDNLNLEQVDFITSLPQLESLSLFGCRIKKLPANISVLKNLKQLGLTGNPIQPEEINRLKRELPHCKIVFTHS